MKPSERIAEIFKELSPLGNYDCWIKAITIYLDEQYEKREGLWNLTEQGGAMKEETLGIKVTHDTWIGICFSGVAKTTESVIKAFQDVASLKGTVFPNDADIFCAIESPCGRQRVYRKPEDFPLHDVACNCGDPRHWVVKWT